MSCFYWTLNVLIKLRFGVVVNEPLMLQDIIIGLTDYDVIYGGDGNDIIYGRSHDDVLYGGNGNDTLYGESWYE